MVERSDSFDGAWGDGPDDDLDRYPAAPVPAHERTWRHPSEVGEATWVQTEPPIAIGRGLMATTGLVGCALGLAVVWLLVPGGLDQQPLSGPMVTRSVGAVGGVTATTDPPASLLATTTVVEGPSSTSSSAGAPAHTVAVQSTASAAPATAVLITGTSLMLTTAAAVREQQRVSVEDASEVLHEASVVGVSGELVVLTAAGSTDAPVDVVGFDAIGRADAGDPVTVLAAEPVQVDYPEQDAPLEMDGTALDADIPEGTPVVDADGVLVALCTHVETSDDRTEVRVVPVADVLASLFGDELADPTTTGEGSGDDAEQGGGWLGLRLAEATGSAAVLVDGVAPDSPAALAGVEVGEIVQAIDGVAMNSIADVRAALTGSAPGDTVVLTVLAADGSVRDVSVVLGVAVPDV